MMWFVLLYYGKKINVTFTAETKNIPKKGGVKYVPISKTSELVFLDDYIQSGLVRVEGRVREGQDGACRGRE